MASTLAGLGGRRSTSVTRMGRRALKRRNSTQRADQSTSWLRRKVRVANCQRRAKCQSPHCGHFMPHCGPQCTEILDTLYVCFPQCGFFCVHCRPQCGPEKHSVTHSVANDAHSVAARELFFSRKTYTLYNKTYKVRNLFVQRLYKYVAESGRKGES